MTTTPRPTTSLPAALTLLLLLLLLAGCGSAGRTTASPHVRASPTPSWPSLAPSVPSRDESAARAILGAPGARLYALAVTPGRPGRRMAEWYVCRDPHCHRRTYAAAVSDDGFRTRHVVELARPRVANGWYLETAGPDHFAISPNGGRRSLVDLTGDVTPIRVTGPAGPLVGQEVPLRATQDGFLGVNTQTGEAHPLSTPAGVVDVRATPSGQLRALTYDHPRYYWSADGGAAWHRIPLPADDRDLSAELVPTPSDSVHVLLLGGENTVFPWVEVLRSTDGRTWTSYAGPRDPTGFVDAGVVLPDGRLLMDVDGWSDQVRHRPSVNVAGLWAGHDWTHLRPVPHTGPFVGQDPHRFVPTVLDVGMTTRRVTLYALTPDQRGAVSSSDGGDTWRRERAR